MSRRREIATRLLLLRAIKDQVGKADAAARAEARAEFDRPGVRDLGIIPAPGEDGADAQIGSVTVKAGALSSRITGPDSFLTWVQETYPEQVETVTYRRVRLPFQDRVLAAYRRQGYWMDETTGEARDVPGLQQTAGDPTLEVRPSAGAADRIQDAAQAGLLSITDVLALPVGEVR